MNVAKVTAAKPIARGQVPQGAFSWATAYQFDERDSGKVKCCAQDASDIYTGSQTDGIRRWDAGSGGSNIAIAGEQFGDPVHTIGVLGSSLWVCTGNGATAGTVIIYDLETGLPRAKGFTAHKGEVTCMAAGPNNAYMVTGGVDFQVKVWSPDGAPIATTGHHNKQVDCLLFTPLPSQDGTAKHQQQSAKLWSGSADGTVWCWLDLDGTGQVDTSQSQTIRMDGSKPVKCMALSGQNVWCGCDSGQICIYRAENGGLVKTLRAHTDTVDTLACVGTQVWSGSRDRTILAHDAATCVTLFSLGDQGAGVRSLMSAGWHIWAVNTKNIRIYTAEAIWQAEVDNTKAVTAELDATRTLLSSQLQQEKAAGHALGMQLREQDAKYEASCAELSARIQELEKQVAEEKARADAVKSAAEKEGEAANKQLAELSDQIKKLEGSSSELQATCDHLLSARDSLDKDKQELTSSKEALESANLKLQQQADALQAQLQAAQQEQEKTNSQLESAIQREELLKSSAGDDAVKTAAERQQLNKEMAELKDRLASLQGEHSTLQREKDESQQVMQAKDKELASRAAELEQASQKLNSTEAELQDTKKVLQEAQTSLQESTSALETANNNLEELKKQLAAAQQDVTDGKTARDQLTADVAGKDAQLAALQDTLTQLIKEKEQLCKDLAAARELGSNTDSQLKEALAELQSLKQSSNQLIADHDALAKQAAALQQQLDEATARSDNLQLERDRLSSELKTATEATNASDTDKAKLQAALENKVTEIETLRKDSNNLQSLLAKAKEDYDALSQEQNRIASERDQLQKDLENAKEAHQQQNGIAITELDAAKQEISKLEGQIKGLEQQLALAQNKILSLEQGSAVSEQALKDAEEQMKKLLVEQKKLQDQLSKQESERAELESEKARLKSEKSQLESEKAGSVMEREMLKASLDDLQQQLQQAKKQIADDGLKQLGTEQQLRDSERREQELQSSLQTLQQKLSKAEDELRSAEQRVRDAQARAEQERTKQGLEEDLMRLKQRVADLESDARHAAHTSQPPTIHMPPITPNIIVNVPGNMSSPASSPAPSTAQLGTVFGQSTQSTLPPDQYEQQVEDLPSQIQQLKEVVERLKGQNQALEKQLHESRDACEQLQTSKRGGDLRYQDLQQQLEVVSEESYTNQLALRAAQRELEALNAERKALEGEIENLKNEISMLRSEISKLTVENNNRQSPPDSSTQNLVSAAAADRSQANPVTPARAAGLLGNGSGTATNGSLTPRQSGAAAKKMALLEGALKQATSDYQMLLAEISSIRSQVSARDEELAAAAAARSALEVELIMARKQVAKAQADNEQLAAQMNEVARLQGALSSAEARVAQLTRMLAECEAHRRRFEDLETAHSSVKQRLEVARLSDGLFNCGQLGQSTKSDLIPAAQPRPLSQPTQTGLANVKGEKVRYIPPTGFG